MWRVIVQPSLFFVTPFLVYVAYLVFRETFPFATEHWDRRVFSSLTLTGLAFSVLGMLVLGLLAPRHQGAYVPAHIENGTLVPGRME